MSRRELTDLEQRLLAALLDRRSSRQGEHTCALSQPPAVLCDGRAGNAEAATDSSLRAEILSYSRSQGLFAGVSLEGTSLRTDDDASKQVYGRKMTARNIVTGKRIAVPASGRHLVDVLEKSAPHNESKKTSSR